MENVIVSVAKVSLIPTDKPRDWSSSETRKLSVLIHDRQVEGSDRKEHKNNLKVGEERKEKPF